MAMPLSFASAVAVKVTSRGASPVVGFAEAVQVRTQGSSTVTVPNTGPVSSDTFFYRIGELIMTENDYAPLLQEEVRKFGFGSDPGIALPFAFDGTVPDAELKKEYAERGVISEAEASRTTRSVPSSDKPLGAW